MTPGEVHAVLLEELAKSAPETDASTLDPHTSLREALDLDSFDFQNLLGRLEARLGVRIAQEDAARLDTLAGAVAYLAPQLADRPAAH